jgi:hypothetical protein
MSFPISYLWEDTLQFTTTAVGSKKKSMGHPLTVRYDFEYALESPNQILQDFGASTDRSLLELKVVESGLGSSSELQEFQRSNGRHSRWTVRFRVWNRDNRK